MTMAPSLIVLMGKAGDLLEFASQQKYAESELF